MDDSETLHRRARRRELVKVRFGGEQKALFAHILSRTGKAANQGELSLLTRDNSGKSFGDKKARPQHQTTRPSGFFCAQKNYFTVMLDDQITFK